MTWMATGSPIPRRTPAVHQLKIARTENVSVYGTAPATGKCSSNRGVPYSPFVQHHGASSGHPTPTPRCLSGRHAPAIPIQGPEYLSGHRRRDRRLRFAMIWRVMTVAPPMAAATAKPATPERTMARCPTTTPRKPESMAVIAKPVIEKNPAFRSRHSHLVYPFIVSLQLVRDARGIAVGRLARSYETLGNPGIPPFLPSRPLLAAFSGMRVELSFFIFVPVAMPSTGRTGRSRIRVPNHSRQQSGMGLRRPGDRPASADGSQSRRARGYCGGRATPGAAQRCRRRPGPGGSAALPTFPHAGC